MLAMHHLPRIFDLRKHSKRTEQTPTSKPRLVRTNAVKNFDYNPPALASVSTIGGSSGYPARSLDVPHDVDKNSFRIDSSSGEVVDAILQRMGLSGVEDLEIPMAAFETMNKSSSDIILRPKKGHFDHDEPNEVQEEVKKIVVDTLSHRDEDNALINLESKSKSDKNELRVNPNGIGFSPLNGKYDCPVVNRGGIKGDRPPLLTPPPAMSLPVLDDGCSTWEICQGFGPDSGSLHFFYRNTSLLFDGEGDGIHTEGFDGVRMGETSSGFSSFATTNDDDSSSTTTEPGSIISPRLNIFPWEKGALLGRGSFGSVYEGISSEGFFFAVKEVSLLEQGSQGKQSIYQLEQEIELLGQFQHENIVQYLGTDKDDSNLYIFLELVTQGSLASLYQKYRLRDSHASVYTRQILVGLKYLHDKKVVHRDIKCSNILVASNGTVKLADFGLAKATRLNDLKSCKGTVFWMAPEVVYHKNRGYGLPADIWSLGCTVLEMLTGHVPYHPLEFSQAIFRIGKGEPPSIPDLLSRNAQDFIRQCLRVNPNDRPTASELLEHPFLRRPLHAPPGSESPMQFSR